MWQTFRITVSLAVGWTLPSLLKDSYIRESFQNLISEVTTYLTKYTPYHGYLFEDDYQNVAPGAWCGAGQKLGFSEDMIQFSISIVTASPATASLERRV